MTLWLNICSNSIPHGSRTTSTDIGTQSKILYVMLTFGKTQKFYFLNRMKYIEGSLVKSSGKISREHLKLLLRKKSTF